MSESIDTGGGGGGGSTDGPITITDCGVEPEKVTPNQEFELSGFVDVKNDGYGVSKTMRVIIGDIVLVRRVLTFASPTEKRLRFSANVPAPESTVKLDTYGPLSVFVEIGDLYVECDRVEVEGTEPGSGDDPTEGDKVAILDCGIEKPESVKTTESFNLEGFAEVESKDYGVAVPFFVQVGNLTVIRKGLTFAFPGTTRVEFKQGVPAPSDAGEIADSGSTPVTVRVGNISKRCGEISVIKPETPEQGGNDGGPKTLLIAGGVAALGVGAVLERRHRRS